MDNHTTAEVFHTTADDDEFLGEVSIPPGVAVGAEFTFFCDDQKVIKLTVKEIIKD